MTSRSKEANREYMRDYMRAHRKASKARKFNAAHRRAALYDPLRDRPLRHVDLTAFVMGDPPIGWRAIVDRHQARTGIRAISLAGAQG